jgi:hypothetical protein
MERSLLLESLSLFKEQPAIDWGLIVLLTLTSLCFTLVHSHVKTAMHYVQFLGLGIVFGIRNHAMTLLQGLSIQHPFEGVCFLVGIGLSHLLIHQSLLWFSVCVGLWIPHANGAEFWVSVFLGSNLSGLGYVLRSLVDHFSH